MNNSDLSFLTDCSNEQLRLLADVLVFDPKDHKKRYTERLSARASYAVYYPHDMKKLLPEIVDEYQRFGGNTIANIIPVSYTHLLPMLLYTFRSPPHRVAMQSDAVMARISFFILSD